MKVSEITAALEAVAPRPYQESYDNAGLLTGGYDQQVTGVLISLDCTEAIVEEAIAKKCNLVISHHPILFKGIKKLTGTTYVERTLIKAIQNNIAIYAIHTNLDNVLPGVNKKIAEKIGLTQTSILAPKINTLTKLVTFIPREHTEAVMQALHQAGAGQIGNYKNCSFRMEGAGTFMPNEQASPHVGKSLQQETVAEIRAEVIFPTHLQASIINALKRAHPYEEVAYYLTPLSNENQEVGSGLIGHLSAPMDPKAFMKHLKTSMDLALIRHTELIGKKISRVAVCGGAGSFLLPDALRAGAQVFITADIKYHEFFDADNRIILADIGHYESEVFTKDLIGEILQENFPTFAVNFSGTITNPVRYLID